MVSFYYYFHLSARCDQTRWLHRHCCHSLFCCSPQFAVCALPFCPLSVSSCVSAGTSLIKVSFVVGHCCSIISSSQQFCPLDAGSHLLFHPALLCFLCFSFFLFFLFSFFPYLPPSSLCGPVCLLVIDLVEFCLACVLVCVCAFFPCTREHCFPITGCASLSAVCVGHKSAAAADAAVVDADAVCLCTKTQTLTDTHTHTCSFTQSFTQFFFLYRLGVPEKSPNFQLK